MANILYQGNYDNFVAIGAVHAALGKWIETNGHTIIGPNRELYLRVPQLGSGDPSGIMEIQFPVAKQGQREEDKQV